MRRLLHVAVVLVLAGVLEGAAVSGALAQSVELRTSTFAAAPFDAQSPNGSLTGTLGGSTPARTTADGLVIRAGFWAQAARAGAAASVPVARPDTVTTAEDEPVAIDVVDNDVDPGGGVLALAGFGDPAAGAVEQTGDSTLTYTPAPDFFGEDQFDYTVRSAAGDSAHGTVLITVTAVNDPPVFASDPIAGAAAGELYRYEIEATDVDSETLSFSAPELPDWLTLTGAADGTAVLEGTPPAEEAGDHDVVLSVSDGALATEQAFTIGVAVSAPDAPALATPEDGATGLLPPIDLAWNAPDGAQSYRLQIALEPGFASLLVDTTGLSEPSFAFSEVEAGRFYYWRVSAANGAGEGPYSAARGFETSTSVGTGRDELPDAYSLSPNYPNPFNPSTRITFTLPEPGRVSLRIYDARGREVARLIERELPPGTHAATWDARDAGGRLLPSGVYFYRMTAQGFSETRSMVLLQ